MALNQRRGRRKARKPVGDRQVEAVVEVLRGAARTPVSQAQLVVALLRAMGGPSGATPNMVAIATQLGITHQGVYRMLGALEDKGVVTRRSVLEISL